MSQENQSNPIQKSEGSPVPPERLLRLAVDCPACGSRPALRISITAATDAGRHAPSERLGTYQCQRRACGVVYDLRAEAYQQAK